MRSSFLLAAVLCTVMFSPALAQNRFMDEAKQVARDREERQAIWKAEHPDPVPVASAPAVPAQAQPADPVPTTATPAPATPATQ